MFACIGDAAIKGETYWLKSVWMENIYHRNYRLHPLQQHYFKAHAYRVKPLATKGCCTIDGEEFPFEEFEVAVRPGLATFLSPYGRYAAQLTFTHGDEAVKT